jgi:tyrosine decarboxylase/aspartate 1-decarboxylase
MVDEEVDWRWQEDGIDINLVDVVKKIRSPYEDESPMCYPGTNLDPDVAAAASILIAKQINAIGNHTHALSCNADGTWIYREGEGGFEQVQKIEREALWMIASTLGIDDTSKIEGYFCGGGTEANEEGIWIGRNWLRQCPDPMKKGIVVLATSLRHYSIDKAVELTGIGESQRVPCPDCGRDHIFIPDPSGGGIILVGMDYDDAKRQSHGEMSLDELKRIFKQKYEEGFRRFMIVPTVGTSLRGSIDQIKEIGNFIREASKNTGAYFYMHVDASFAGFTVPFVAPELPFAFSVPEVMSITLDADKMGHMPYPAGVFLCRKGLMSLVAQKVNYVRGNEDDTLSGSRSCVAPVLFYYEMKKRGKKGQREYVQKCLDFRNKLIILIKKRLPWINPLPASPYVNFAPMEIDIHNGEIPKFFLEQTIEHEEWVGAIKEGTTKKIDKKIPNELKYLTIEEKKNLNGLLAKHHLRADCFPREPKNPQSCPVMVYKVCIMPHTFGHFDGFISDLAKVKEKWRKV